MSTEAPSAPPAYDLDQVAAHLAATDAELEVYIDETHLTYLPIYLGRADAMHLLGPARGDTAAATAEQVLRQLWLASRCYAGHGEVYLAKWPRHQFRRRRLLPLELALAVADAKVLERVVAVCGVEPMTLLAGAEHDDITHEVRVLTGFFRGGRIEDQADLAGCLAVLYWLVMSAIASGDNEALETIRALSVRVLGDHQHLARRRTGGLGRMLCVHQVIGNLRPASPAAIVDALAEHGRIFREGVEAALAEEDGPTATGDGALDTTTLALLAMAAAAGIDLGARLAAADDPNLAQALAYAEVLGHTAAA